MHGSVGPNDMPILDYHDCDEVAIQDGGGLAN
jgi:hypothetical protein